MAAPSSPADLAATQLSNAPWWSHKITPIIILVIFHYLIELSTILLAVAQSAATEYRLLHVMRRAIYRR